MNKLVYISLLSFGVLFVSCQKEDVTPLNSEEILTPTWEEGEDRFGLNDADHFVETGESNARGGSGNEEGEGGGNGAGPGNGNEEPPPVGGNGGITDPNEDPDGNGKGKGDK